MLNVPRKFPYAPGLALTALLLMAASPANAQRFTRTDLAQDAAGVSATAPNTDPNLVNPWGLSRSSGSPWWVSDNGTGLSTLYNATGVAQSLVVTIDPPAGGASPSAPTGTVYNYTTSFLVAPGKPAIFLFVTEDGTILGWNPGIRPTFADVRVDRSHTAVYKGCAIAQTAGGPRFYATNFTTGLVEIFDSTFHRIPLTGTQFRDTTLPADFVPFNIQNIGGDLVVTFAHRTPGSKDEDHGPGMGYVAIFDAQGNFISRLPHGTYFNAPWGVVEAPGDFGVFSHRLLIGNFGDGYISAFDPISGTFQGQLQDNNGAPLWIEGLWALSFGNNANAGNATDLYFTAGPSDESHGILGKVTPIASDQRGNSE